MANSPSSSRGNIRAVTESGLCVSCLACGSVCSVAAIRMVRVSGLRRPSVDESVCTMCGNCARVCPGLSLPGVSEPQELGLQWLVGEVRGAYTGFAVDASIRAAGVSGGVCTAMLLSLRESGVVDRVFGLGFAGVPGTDADVTELTDAMHIRAAAGSKYCPPAINQVLDALASDSHSRIAVVGTSCCLQAIRQFMELRQIDPGRLLTLGLMCDRTLSPRALDHIAVEQGLSVSDITSVRYRDKGNGGWPGGVTIDTKSRGRVQCDREVRTRLKQHYQLRRCTVCADKFNLHADVVLGDCYVSGLESKDGSSIVLSRTWRGEEALRVSEPELMLSSVSLAEVTVSQVLSAKLPALDAAVAVSEELGFATGRSLTPEREKRARCVLRASWRRIALGERVSPFWVRSAIWLGRAWARASKMAARVEMVIALMWLFLRSVNAPKQSRQTRDLRSVLVVGAGFANRGAQAMLFAVMDSVREHYPDAEIYLAHSASVPDAEERYRLKVLPWTHSIKACLWGWPLSQNAKRWYPGYEEADAVDAVLRSCDCVVDISGFRLSSEFGPRESVDYCTNILLARIYGVRSFILPQSFGPFDYGVITAFLLRPFVRQAVRSAERTWARESAGYELLSGFKPKRLDLAPDIVLMHSGRVHGRIYRSGYGPRNIQVEGPAACIVPSLRVMERRCDDDIEGLYCAVAEQVVQSGRSVWLLAHSREDAALCERIEAALEGRVAVCVAPKDLDAIEIELLLDQMDFLVTSRYHSLVHAYRCGVPALILGWAIKYQELAALVGQERYVLGADASIATVLESLEELVASLSLERGAIERSVRSDDRDATQEFMRSFAQPPVT